MSPSTPISTDASPVFNRTSTDRSTPSSPTSATTPTFPPRSPLTRASTSEPTLFARIRSSRTSSSALRSPNSVSEPNSTNPDGSDCPSPSLNPRSNSCTTISAAPRTRSRSQKRNSGTTMQVGRHSNDWLFGGFSFTEAVKTLLSPGGENDHPGHHPGQH